MTNSAQWALAVTTLVRYATRTVLALLVPTLLPTRWQQSVSTARRRRRRRNCRRIGWTVTRRCERQRRGSLLD